MMLSQAKLFAARSQEQSLPQRSHGQKDFLPDGSEIQNDKLQICRAEQRKLLAEERVERLGNLGRGVWTPEKELVELTLPAGKFWQTMGFTEGGRQCLLPEEAVYLLECGTIQIFYRHLPLSVQEAYGRLLSCSSFSLLQYQVYSHLKRFGYIVTRFDPSSIQLPYERQINLESDVVSNRKRKRSSRPCSLKSQNVSEMPGNISSKPKINNCQEAVVSFAPEPVTFVPIVLENIKSDEAKKNNNKSANREEKAKYFDATVKSQRKFRWDFSKICFPNCACDQLCLQLPDPEPSFLPTNVIGRQADISPWLGKLNLHPEKYSRRELELLEWERKYKISINTDPKMKKCSNWNEYKRLLRERACQSHNERPAHLWSTTVRPLLTPGHVKSTASVLEQVAVISQSKLVEDGKRFQDKQNILRIHFNLYQADGNTEFKKSKPGKPYAYLCVHRFDELIPSLQTIKNLAYQSGEIPVLFALVDCGEIAFYTLKDFQLPVDV
ncbi:tRNA-splicing endonuclease subunit Sen54 isoform X2 [Hyla sarda]|uniref:tRNA-splicing endonuclease subunit Sen54 isoform X2 n=1 Tax=Hyla sarda TaxID=327740 RepID=UPI0024C3CBEF|nr:tRNA-splicing endonuclease subunit Sen54 isoform X2 [Hyla sarda]